MGDPIICLQEAPASGQYFVFINRRKTHMKILYFEFSGYFIWLKRLEQGQFNYHMTRSGKKALDAARLQWLIEGIDVQIFRQFKRYLHSG